MRKLPINDFFILSSDKVLLFRGDDAQRVLLACFGLCVNDICADIHVDSTLRQRAWLEDTKHHKNTFRTGSNKIGIPKASHMLAENWNIRDFTSDSNNGANTCFFFVKYTFVSQQSNFLGF